MTRFSYLVALLLAGAALAAPSALAADYTAYVGCSTSRDAPPATSCLLGDSPGAFFRTETATVKYDVCVDFPDGSTSCARDFEASPGTLYASQIVTGLIGPHTVRWEVGGAVVASWQFELLPASTPPPPVIPPLNPAPSVAAPAAPPPPSLACSRERQRVKRLVAKLGQAQGKLEKTRVRARLKAARAAVRRHC